MKALIRKYPTNAVKPENNEIWYGPWPDADENGVPYTLEGYRYAMCENAPEPVFDEYTKAIVSPTIDDFEVTEHEKTVGEGEEARVVKYWTATYKGKKK